MVIQQYLIIINLSLSIDNSQSFNGAIEFSIEIPNHFLGSTSYFYFPCSLA